MSLLPDHADVWPYIQLISSLYSKIYRSIISTITQTLLCTSPVSENDVVGVLMYSALCGQVPKKPNGNAISPELYWFY